ncbi:32248_t:CDS:2, partial [Gigaspora margarita]
LAASEFLHNVMKKESCELILLARIKKSTFELQTRQRKLPENASKSDEENYQRTAPNL